MNNIILCGFKSSGKTTLAKKISEKTGMHYIDTDELVSKNCRQLYLQGPEAFRDIEKEVIKALVGFENCIIATGGGAILDKRQKASGEDRLMVIRPGRAALL